jgi:hypothetical protein
VTKTVIKTAVKPPKLTRTQKAALIKRQLDLVAGIPLTPPRLYIGPARDKVLGTDPTKYYTGPIPRCRPHGQPLKWCLICAARRGY